MIIRKSIFVFGITAVLSLTSVATAPLVFAQAPAASSVFLTDQTFFKKKYSIKGSWSLVQRGDKTFIQFSDDFKTKNGPDLKVFLSPKSSDEVSGQNALEGSVKLGVLKNKKGAQEYEIPAGVDLSSFSTVLIHCEAYSVLWGGGSIK